MKKGRFFLIAALIILLSVGCAFWAVHAYSATYITIDGVQYRRDAASLDLSGKPITQLDRVMELQNLKSLDLRGTGITAQDVARLNSALSGCEILWEPFFQGTHYSLDTTTLTVASLTGEDVAYLDHFPHLETIHAENCADYDQLLALTERRPACQVLYSVSVGEQAFDCTVTDVTAADLTAEQVETLLKYLPRLESLTLTGQLPEAEALTSLTQQYPHVNLNWQVALLGICLTDDTTSLDISGISLNTTEEIERVLPYLPRLEEFAMCGCGVSTEQVDILRKKYENIHFIWDITIGNATVRTDDAEIDLSGNILTVEQVEGLLPYFTNLEKVIMSNCGISNEEMDALNRRYENIRFVWTVYIKHVPVRTDITYFMPYKLSIQVRDKDLYNLRYCTEVVCVDLGHMDVTSCEFASYMPHLKYLLLGDTMITDISPLAGLQELIYLELFMTYVKDYSPLLECPALEDLNICGTYGSPEPISKLTWLKNLWWGGKYILSDEEDRWLQECLPNTYLELETISSTAAGWRKLQNYYDMRDLLGMWYME